MNCRGVSKSLPILAAGELDAAAAAQAMRHIAGCVRCSQELAGYRRALSLLSGPRPVAETPPALDMLRLPDARPRFVFRPILAAAASCLLLLALCIPWLLRKPAPMPSVSPSSVTEVASAVGSGAEMGASEQGTGNSEQAVGNRRQETGNMEQGLGAGGHGIEVRRLGRVRLGHRTWRARVRPVLVRRDDLRDEPAVRPKVLLLVASSVELPEESVMEIESVNRATGTVTRFSSRIDDSTADQTTETESIPDMGDSGRVQ